MEKDKQHYSFEFSKYNFDEHLARGAFKVFYKSLDDCDSAWAEDSEELKTGAACLRKDLEHEPPSYVAVEIDDNSQKVIGAINGQCALYATPKGIPEKVPSSALKKMGNVAPKEVFYVDTVAVDPDHQEKGIASKLLKQCQDFAHENGYKYLFLRTNDSEKNQSVIDFYTKRKWENLGHFPEGKDGKTHFFKKIETPSSAQKSYVRKNVEKVIGRNE